MTLTNLEQLVSELMPHYTSAFNKLIHSDQSLVDSIIRTIGNSRGKQLRPLLTIATACCCGLPSTVDANHPVFSVAAAVETLHNSTLLHDDVVDNSDLRRGKPTANSIYGNKMAVLMGDFCLSQVMRILNAIDIKPVTEVINNAVTEMAEGEILQLSNSGRYSNDIETYLKIIRKKTAVFMSACCKAGAILANSSEATVNAAGLFGESLGMAFQIRDDMIDFLPQSVTGKPQGNDIREHKCTLPLIFALEETDPNTKNDILAFLEKTTINEDDVTAIIAHVGSTSAMDRSREQMRQYVNNAKVFADKLPDNKYRDSLKELTIQLTDF